MPFTLAHAAAALPLQRLLRGRAALPALVIGCFLPDVPYFLPAPLCDINAHRWPGLLLFGVPCGWILWGCWYRVLRLPCAALLPPHVAAWLGVDRPRAAAGWTTLAFVAGAVSHALWDACTHRRGFVVQAWQALAAPVARVDGHVLALYTLLQHGSSAVGLAALLISARREVRKFDPPSSSVTPPQLSARAKTGTRMPLAIGLLASACWPLAARNAVPSPYQFVCGSISAAASLLLAYALAFHAERRARSPLARRVRSCTRR